ncbi:MAG: hypothetical protein U0X91_22685 [Spirosomataceae bacterium]
MKDYKIAEHCMIANAAESPTRKANAGRHSVSAHVARYNDYWQL